MREKYSWPRQKSFGEEVRERRANIAIVFACLGAGALGGAGTIWVYS